MSEDQWQYLLEKARGHVEEKKASVKYHSETAVIKECLMYYQGHVHLIISTAKHKQSHSQCLNQPLPLLYYT